MRCFTPQSAVFVWEHGRALRVYISTSRYSLPPPSPLHFFSIRTYAFLLKMPSRFKKQSKRARTWDSAVGPLDSDADLRAMFFSPDAIADVVPLTPVNTPIEQLADHHQLQYAFGAPWASVAAAGKHRGKSLSTPTARHRLEDSTLRFQQRPFEPIFDDEEIEFPTCPSTAPKAAAAGFTERIDDGNRATIQRRAGSVVLRPLHPGLARTDTPKRANPTTSIPTDSAAKPRKQIIVRSSLGRFSIMASLNPSSAYRLTGQRSVTQEQAKEQQMIIEQKLSRAGQPNPPYDFVDLIGKGSFGRVYLGWVILHCIYPTSLSS